MNMRNVCLYALALGIGMMIPPHLAQAGPRIPGEALDPACLQAANDQVAVWKLQGKTNEELEKLYDQAIMMCAGASPSLSAYASSANFDLSRFARMFISNTMSPSTYVMLSRDRGRKLRRAVKDPAWVQAWLQGDADQDLVPNSMDQCPSTPASTPTTDTGCPSSSAPPKMPTDDQIKAVQSKLSFIIDPHCTGDDLPGVAQPVKSGMQFPFPNFLIGLMHPNNQPSGCTIFYEVQITFSDRKSATVPVQTTVGAVFAREENTNTSSNGGMFQIFRIPSSASGPRKLMYDTATKYNKKTMKVRVMNGAGLTSGWSAPLVYNKPFFTDLQVQ